ncbi:MAG: hypothetical protein O3B24_03535 [Verrucomicrobia bacterium]|nr:hypothetical protein [Verrucomicrobiota bacterium]
MHARLIWAVVLALGLALPGLALDHAEDRVAYVPGAVAEHPDFDARAQSQAGRALREKALAKRAAYEAALARLPDVGALDKRIAATRAKQDDLAIRREAAAEEHGDSRSLQRDAWIEARDALLTLREASDVSADSLAAAEQRADAAHRAFRDAMATLPDVQDLDHALAAARAELSELYIQRRAMEESSTAHLAPERQAMAEAEAAYLQYVYGQ